MMRVEMVKGVLKEKERRGRLLVKFGDRMVEWYGR